MNSENPSTPPPVVRDSIWVEEPSRRRLWLNWTVSLGLLGFVALLFIPLDSRGKRNPDRTQAISNARQLGMALFEFESDYGHFPEASTAQAVTDRNSSSWSLGDRSSNELFRQLMVAKIVPSEEIFYARFPGTKRPDGKQTAEADAIAAGECGFAYILGASTRWGPNSRPIAVAPLIPGTLKFDRKPFDGRAVVLRCDNSVQSYQLRGDGTAVAPGGMDLFDPSQPYWGGKTPEVKWPELLPVSVSEKVLGHFPWICIWVTAVALLTASLCFLRRDKDRRRMKI